jgi:inorganic triphosphatase YgiF
MGKGRGVPQGVRQVQEIELKFQIPAARQAAVLKAVATATARRTHLQALYFDTPQRHLALARAALRLRREGDTWVQTVKAQGDNPMQRLEHEVVVAQGGPAPALNLARHLGTPAAAALAKALDLHPEDFNALAQAGEHMGLQVWFETDIWRSHRLLHSAGAQIELAHDQGEIRAAGRVLPVCELEMELKAGPVAALVGLAQTWVARHGLWLDVRSKAERGHLLAQGQPASPPSAAPAFRLDVLASPVQAVQAMVAHGLTQVLAQTSVLADAAVVAALAPADAAEHLHQCRVGLRRVRSALALLRTRGSGLDPAWDDALSALLRQLGQTRDLDAVAQSVLPALRRAGAPWTDLVPVVPALAPGEVARSAAAQQLMLALLAWAQAEPEPATAAAGGQPKGRKKALSGHLAPRLSQWQRSISRAARHFEQLPVDQQHRVRKQLKRLRYGLQFSAALWPAKACARQLAALKPVQEALGQYNDLLVASGLFEAQLASHPQAQWALGWLAAEQTRQARRCAKALARALKVPACWG